MPSRSFTRFAKKVKPPDTSSTLRPAFLQAATSSVAPGLSFRRSSYTCCSAATGTPCSSATRRRRLSLKSLISPRIVASVIAATSAFLPTASAISSMHSMLISVESMSNAISLKSASFSGGFTRWRTRPGEISVVALMRGRFP
ncbi:hypothetical protein D9M68_473490 [compost metagenome]